MPTSANVLHIIHLYVCVASSLTALALLVSYLAFAAFGFSIVVAFDVLHHACTPVTHLVRGGQQGLEAI